MIVVAIMGLIAAMAVPSIYQISKKEGMRRAISDLKDVCSNARAQAIFNGRPVSVKFYPTERRFEISGGGGAPPVDPVTGETKSTPNPGPAPGTGTTGIIPADVTLEMLDVNMFEYKDSECVEVRFSERGTSDELTIVLRDAENKYRKLVLEPTTGLLLIGDVTSNLTR
jgi:type II secretory pathway pseudopilin PulG